MVQLLTSTAALVQEWAAATLANLLVQMDTQSGMLAAGAVTPLVRLPKSRSPRVPSAAALALAHLAVDNAVSQAAIVAAGAIAPLALLLKPSGYAQAQVDAAMAL